LEGGKKKELTNQQGEESGVPEKKRNGRREGVRRLKRIDWEGKEINLGKRGQGG